MVVVEKEREREGARNRYIGVGKATPSSNASRHTDVTDRAGGSLHAVKRKRRGEQLHFLELADLMTEFEGSPALEAAITFTSV